MKKRTKNEDHQDGPPWNLVARFNDFHPADIRRQQILAAEPMLQVKVHRRGPEGCYFTVKTRVKPELQLQRRNNRQQKKRRNK